MEVTAVSDQELRSVASRESAYEAHDPRWGSAPNSATGQAPTTYDIGHQQAAGIYQAGRDQYNTYQQRYELRIAPMLDRARRLLRVGVGLMLGATAVYAWIVVLFGREIIDWNEALFSSASTAQQPDLPDVSFAPLAMVPIAFILGFAGFVMVVVALMTRRRARNEERRL
jgi:hypothetical protein